MTWGSTPEGLYGESGIRTHGTLTSTHAFQACTFGHSVISPCAPIVNHGPLPMKELAERVGFEPTEPQAAQRFSRPPDSTALASLQVVDRIRSIFRTVFLRTRSFPYPGPLPVPGSSSRTRVLFPYPGLLRAQEDSNLRPLDPQSNALSS